MARTHQPRVLTIPAGLPFLKILAARLLDGTLSPSYCYDPADPLSLAKVTILVPTRRAARVLRSEFVDLLGGRSAILPVIRPLGETEEDNGFFEADQPALIDLAPPVSGTVMLLELARLILAWRNQLPAIVRSIHADTPLVAPASPADAVWLARALSELIDAVETEGCDWADLVKLDARDFASWWQLTVEFLKIATAFWPARLEELMRSSPARHRDAGLRAEAQRLTGVEHGHPVIVAGSTGSIPAAADLIAAIAEHPQGVIVLPGLDMTMPPEDWLKVGLEQEAGHSAEPASRGHPQYGLYRLLQRLQVDRSDVETLGIANNALADRAEILSRALAPAGATDGWQAWRAGFGDTRLQTALADMALIEAANEREEATAIAIALRLGLERPGADGNESRVALITPDRALARRVTAELARFGIVADDSAGTPFSATQQGILTQLLLEATLRPGDPIPLVSVLKHPLVRFGMSAQSYRQAADALEMIALRGGIQAVDLSTLPALFEQRLAEHLADRHAPRWRLSLAPESLERARDLAARIANSVEPLVSALVRIDDDRVLTDKLPLGQWAEHTGRVLEMVCADEHGDLSALWSDEAGETLANQLGEIMSTDGEIVADGPQWIDIFSALTASSAVKPRAMRHPRVFVFGTLEARLQDVDMLVIGGLNEGSWPGQTTNNPFLSRTMKAEIGLEPPERRIGQLAHDFEMASGTRHLVYSRALRQGSAPTVASRWLQRLVALCGSEFERQLKSRGDLYRHYAALLDRAESQAPAQRPAPKPPAELQPTQFSFSEVGRFRRDPYALYARRILRLDPVDGFNEDPGAAERGTLYHKIVERFVSEAHDPAGPEAPAVMRQIVDELFDAEGLPIHIDIVWRQRFASVGRAFIEWERKRRPEIRKTFTEARGRIELANGITLSGVADRIDLKGANHADIIDYKTGLSPSQAQARSLLDPQLSLEAAALMAGAFRDAGRLTPENLLYVRLKPADSLIVDPVNNELTGRGDNKKSAVDLAEQSVEELARFVEALRSGERGYVSRLIPAQQNDFGGEYDHLARVAEWSTADSEEPANDD
ncbi:MULTISPECIES: double-strand break repair protein AddB [Alphaproteobacteria]|uniref:Double-strand break repair protein AddB n=2 Tax=Alphaproteobacteria TaxID=28211 RepID=A0A512HM92_9HYPH|nr:MULTISPECIES: double-strand break repair protein AddB [Alphaproteobacteria]GEO86571.1 double-strand break repair protein AddB [Ciceribacter naphthalenivorans]GLR20857.1 double-strand break repair protein AddB [Ciceribacter naphthalenivorans]GLT03713.1 double-strand break repair protein AddB [Sphingomonas psychrolutea]